MVSNNKKSQGHHINGGIRFAGSCFLIFLNGEKRVPKDADDEEKNDDDDDDDDDDDHHHHDHNFLHQHLH